MRRICGRHYAASRTVCTAASPRRLGTTLVRRSLGRLSVTPRTDFTCRIRGRRLETTLYAPDRRKALRRCPDLSRKRRVARNRMTARHLGKRLDGIKDAPCETGCTNRITIRKSNHIRYFGNITLRRLCDSYGVTHTQALAGVYLESTRARTSATVAQRPASISEMPRIALTASSTSCGERCGCSGVMLPDMDDSTIMPQIIPQIASLLLKINVPHCLVTLIKKCCCLPFYGHKVLYNRGMVKFS